jgi:superfamily II DNA/RNA helicase
VAFSEKKDDYKIILTTDVLAEGVNLHRANTVINYDTPWNATKLMQRIGRVNRIGQIASHIFVYNFYLDYFVYLKNWVIFLKIYQFLGLW